MDMIEQEYQKWLANIYDQNMIGKKKRNNKAKRAIGPSDLVHTNPKIRAKAKRIFKTQKGGS